MKNYNEIASIVFERREQYEKQKKQKKKFLTHTVTPICCALLVALLGLGACKGGLFKKMPLQTADGAIVEGTNGPADAEKPSGNNDGSNSKENNTPNNQYTTADILGMVIYNNKTYIQTSISKDDIVLDKKIGTGEDFDGTFNSQWLQKKYEETGILCYYGGTVKAEIYTVIDNSDLLCAVLENGGYVILKKFDR